MLDIQKLSFGRLVDALKAVAEPTRLRLVLLLARSDLTVSELTAILGQSQPRISRHLKLLAESGVLTRYQEGAWAYFRLSEEASVSGLVHAVLNWADEADPVIERDGERLDAVRVERARRAADYFARNAGSWDTIRALHASDAEVEQALLAALGNKRIGTLLDVGTGTGRMLELLAPRCERAVGIDASREMLAIARAKLDGAGIGNARGAPGRGLSPAGRASGLRPRDHPSGAALSGRSAGRRRRGGAGRRAGRPAGDHRLRAARAGIPARRACASAPRLFRRDAGRLCWSDAGLELVSLDHLVSSGGETGELTVTILHRPGPAACLVAGAEPRTATTPQLKRAPS